MRKILIGALLLLAVTGITMPALALVNTNANVATNAVLIGQGEMAVSTPLGNTAIFGNAGNQVVYEYQGVYVEQKIQQLIISVM
jgi:hypothetical protein